MNKIVISHINERALERITDVDINNDRSFSFYQILNSVFAVTALAQLIPLLIAGVINLIKPFTLKITVPSIVASLGNCTIILITGLFFLFSIFLIIDLIQNIFTTGQTVNFVFAKEKIEKSQNETPSA